LYVNNTEGGEARNPDAGASLNESSKDDLLRNEKLQSEFEPFGSQQYQYNGKFTVALPAGMHERPEVVEQ
jgi:hypothetical protein